MSDKKDFSSENAFVRQYLVISEIFIGHGCSSKLRIIQEEKIGVEINYNNETRECLCI